MDGLFAVFVVVIFGVAHPQLCILVFASFLESVWFALS